MPMLCFQLGPKCFFKETNNPQKQLINIIFSVLQLVKGCEFGKYPKGP